MEGDNITDFLNHFGRGQYSNPTNQRNPCQGDFDNDDDVDMKKIVIALSVFLFASPSFPLNSTDEIIVLGDSIMAWDTPEGSGEDSIFKELERRLTERGYKPLQPKPGIPTQPERRGCESNTNTPPAYFLGGTAIANYLGTAPDIFLNCNLAKDALKSSTAKWAIVMLGSNDCSRMHREKDIIRNDFKTLIENIVGQERIPIVISEYFVNDPTIMNGAPAGGPCRWDCNDNMYWLAGEMKTYCSDNDIPFFDLSDYIFRDFSPDYPGTDEQTWNAVDQQMKTHWVDVYLPTDGNHPDLQARTYIVDVITPWLYTVLDLDSDGVIDADDNCPNLFNPKQIDTNKDGNGDVCEFCLAKKIYGEHSEELEQLRYLRDDILSKTLEGCELIKLYYQWSSVITKAMERDEVFKREVKSMFDELLPMIEEVLE